MARGRPKQMVVLLEADRQQPTSVAHSRSLPHGLVTRARLVLMAAEAEKLGLSFVRRVVSAVRQIARTHFIDSSPIRYSPRFLSSRDLYDGSG